MTTNLKLFTVTNSILTHVVVHLFAVWIVCISRILLELSVMQKRKETKKKKNMKRSKEGE